MDVYILRSCRPRVSNDNVAPQSRREGIDRSITINTSRFLARGLPASLNCHFLKEDYQYVVQEFTSFPPASILVDHCRQTRGSAGKAGFSPWWESRYAKPRLG